MEQKKMSAFEELSRLNVNDKTEKKNGLTYLSWAWAWAELMKRHPDSSYRVYENADGWMYHHDGRTAWVKVGVTIDGAETVEYLPVMDHRNRSIPLKDITSMDAIKTVQRAVTKAIARACGLGLYLYAGEDVPEEDEQPKQEEPAQEDADMLGKLRGQILDIVDGDVERVNRFLAKAIKGAPKLEDLNAGQLEAIRDIIADRMKKGTSDDQNVR